MSGHGHVWPNPGGIKARCGGPALCSECRTELTLAKARRAGHRVTVRPPAPVDIKVNQQGEAALAGLLTPFLHAKSIEIARRIRPALAKAAGDPWDDPAIAAAVQAVKDAEGDEARQQAQEDLADLVREKLGMSIGDWSVLARPTAAQLEAVHYAAGIQALDSIGFNEGDQRGTDIGHPGAARGGAGAVRAAGRPGRGARRLCLWRPA